MKKSCLFAIFLLIISVLSSCKYYNNYYTNSTSDNPSPSQPQPEEGSSKPQVADYGDASLEIEGIQLFLDGISDDGKWSVALGDRYFFDSYVELTPFKASLKNIEYSTSDETVAYFDEDHNFITLREGECQIILKSKNSDKEISQPVVVENKSIYFSSKDRFGISASKNWSGVIEYSTDARHWYEWYGETIKANRSQKDEKYYVYLRGKGNPTGINSTIRIVSIGDVSYEDLRVRCDGNLGYLLNCRGTGALEESCSFYSLFSSCVPLESAPALPTCSAEKHISCRYMFSGCTSLTTAPALPATTLAFECYQGMFSGCTSLTTAPALPATTLTGSCYPYMFSGCTSLTSAPALPATTLADSCYQGMFSGCTSLTSSPELPATTLADNCYYNMFSGCTSLTTAPALPATTLAYNCYSSMFSGCTSLTTAPALPATTLADNCYYNMFSGCTSLTTAPALPATDLAWVCYYYMFSGCTSLTTAPALPATTLAGECYQGMFSGCTSLASAPELPATDLKLGCYSNMFSGCTSLTSAPALPATTLANDCYVSMFQDCVLLNAIPSLSHLPYIHEYQSSFANMFSGCELVKFSETQHDEYTNSYVICSSGENEVDVENIFAGTGGEFTGSATEGKVYYTPNEIIGI